MNLRNGLPLPEGEYMFSGVRPSSGAERQRAPVTFGQSDSLERADVAAAEDGRTPLNAYEGEGWGEGKRDVIWHLAVGC